MRKQNLPACFAGIGLLILILDTKIAISGAAEGIEICIQTLIPSLFPFLFLSGILTSAISGKKIKLLQPLGRLLRIPQGTEAIMVIGLLGGYPVGAQCVAQAVNNRSISRETGKRMLAFCSNAGPSFLFGIGTRLFSQIWMCWLLWGIHICSALLVGILIPGKRCEDVCIRHNAPQKPAEVLRRSVQVMGIICGWVVLFRVVLAFCQRWFLWLLPDWGQTIVAGVLELANGCMMIAEIENASLRFILFSAFLGFGGICVVMQTYSVCEGTVTTWYLPGKLLQCIFSILMACAVISREMTLPCLFALTILSAGIYFLNRRTEKRIAFRKNAWYDKEKTRRLRPCCFVKKLSPNAPTAHTAHR